MNEYGLLNPDDYNLTIVGLNATPTGAVDVCVLRFNAAATTTGNIAIADWCEVLTTADEGTTFRILRPGLYSCTLGVSMPASSAAWPGISVDAPAQRRSENPSVATDPAVFVAGAGLITTVAAQTDVEHVPAVVPVSQLAANGGDSTIRFHCSDGADAAVAAASLDLPQVFARIQRVGDLRSRA